MIRAYFFPPSFIYIFFRIVPIQVFSPAAATTLPTHVPTSVYKYKCTHTSRDGDGDGGTPQSIESYTVHVHVSGDGERPVACQMK